MFNFRIAIDGPSGSGKSTIAKKIAKHYNLKYINTGLVYRAIAFYMNKNNVDIKNEKKIKDKLLNIRISLLMNDVVELNGINLTNELRTNKVSQDASILASYTFVREFALKIQLKEASQNKIIMDGRDTTFKIMPTADVKIFLDTTTEVRAKRRMEQNKSLGFETNYEKILSEITIRDCRDRTRKIDPLHKTSDAHLVDSSNYSINEVTKIIIDIINKTKGD